ncbi:hypothetical protein phytr_9490 [Candidatus Phycorickettsia trachydisci]|uniref:Uncharacterized protein n=1 Tax=Candidatus Phycorickettsia trachydisci TaxID=2115978 RepID=A0A2P1P9E1_9RICK|nr:hypothetical protein [Candidatus Phycorickettsia trachydisci]AVP87877.1 hypothetical protein phytr_9490 [Candidatus Phycorickettsia trachydisci]
MQEKPNQVATIDLWKLHNDIKLRKFSEITKVKFQDTEQEVKFEDVEFRGLSNLPSMAYIPSLANLSDLQRELDKALNNKDIKAIKGMQKKFEELRQTCFDDLCTWGKSAFIEDEYKILEESKKDTWNKRIKDYKELIPKVRLQNRANSAFNENLIVPAMDLSHQYFQILEQLDKAPDKITQLSQQIKNFRSLYDSEVKNLKKNQEKQTMLDLGRNGFVVRNNGEYERFSGNPFGENSKEKLFTNNLKKYGLSEAQIDFIVYHGNQSGFTGTATSIMRRAKPCAGLVIDIQTEPSGQRKILLKSLSYNTIGLDDNGNPAKGMDISSVDLLGKAQLLVDISSLGGKEAKYDPGTHKGIKMELTSDFFSNEKAKWVDLKYCGVSSHLLTSEDPQKFQKSYEDIGEGYIKSMTNDEMLNDVFPDAASNPKLQEQYIKAKLFNLEGTFNKEFYERVQLDKSVQPETLNQAVADSVVSHVSKMISSKLDEEKDYKKIGQDVYKSLGTLVPSSSKEIVEKTISDLVLDVAKNKNHKLKLHQKVKIWWNNVVDLLTQSKDKRLGQYVLSKKADDKKPVLKSSKSKSNSGQSFTSIL